MIYRALLEDDFEKLPPVLRAFHSSPGQRCAVGTVSIRRHNGFLAWLVGFPQAGDRVPVKLEVVATGDQETWTRWFGGVMRSSTQRAAGGLLVEEAGPVLIAFRLRASKSGMSFESQRMQLWGIPVPLRIEASARGAEKGWEVEVNIPYVGSYRGMLTPNA